MDMPTLEELLKECSDAERYYPPDRIFCIHISTAKSLIKRAYRAGRYSELVNLNQQLEELKNEFN